MASDADLVRQNPSAGIKNLKRPKTGGFRQSAEGDIAAFHQKWPIETRERLALEIFVNTGLRRRDAARLGRQHIRDGRLQIVTEKTDTLIDIPVPQDLPPVILASKTGDLVLIGNFKTGAPIRKEALGNWFKRTAVAASILDVFINNIKERDRGTLAVFRVAGKDWTPNEAIDRMFELCQDNRRVPDCGFDQPMQKCSSYSGSYGH